MPETLAFGVEPEFGEGEPGGRRTGEVEARQGDGIEGDIAPTPVAKLDDPDGKRDVIANGAEEALGARQRVYRFRLRGDVLDRAQETVDFSGGVARGLPAHVEDRAQAWVGCDRRVELAGRPLLAGPSRGGSPDEAIGRRDPARQFVRARGAQSGGAVVDATGFLRPDEFAGRGDAPPVADAGELRGLGNNRTAAGKFSGLAGETPAQVALARQRLHGGREDEGEFAGDEDGHCLAGEAPRFERAGLKKRWT